MSDIRIGLQAGNEIIAHTDPVSIPGWSGAGYVIFDPISGGGAYKITGGRNGGFQLVIDTFVFNTAAALGYVDGKIGHLAGETFIFSDRLKYLSKLAKTSQALGAISLLVSIALIFANDQLNPAQKLGQIAMTMLGFGIVASVTASAAVLLGGGFLAAAIGILVAVTMAVAVGLINAIYFSHLRFRSNRVFA